MNPNQLISKPRDSSKIVYLTSYMRPELTELAIKSVLRWGDLKKLVIIIDGLRSTADFNEKDWREQTIKIAERYCSTSPNLDLWLYDNNIGITEHNMRIQKRALENDGAGIWLEEDFSLDFVNYSQILQELDIEKRKDPVLISAYSHFNHEQSDLEKVKSNLFLPLWGISFNESFFELYNKVWVDKKFNPTVIDKMLKPIFPNSNFSERIFRDKVIDYWTEYLGWGFKNRNRWDAVATYALWTQECYSMNTLQAYSFDLSYLDPRGMNPRIEPEKTRSHPFRLLKVQERLFCLDCELHGSRIPRRMLDRLTTSANYRIKKFSNKNRR